MAGRVDFYEEEDGSAPVEDLIAELPKKPKAKALAIVKLLAEMGPTLPFPYSSQVRGKIRELRTQYGRDKIRILYFGDSRRCFILLDALIKKTDALDEQEIEIAEERMQKHNKRLERSRKR